MNRKGCAGFLAVSTCMTLLFLMSCGSGSSPHKTIAIMAMSGSRQKALTNAAFAAPLVATVTTDGAPTSGVQVTFTAPASGATGTFENGTTMDTEITDSGGFATSTTFTANSTAGDYSVTATTSGATTPANFTLTNTAIAMAFSFYVSGLETINCPNSVCSLYVLAGTVALDTNRNVVAGEQDYNDGAGITSPEPAGDSIVGGSLTVDATGQGTLTLITSNGNLGNSGTETLAVQFVNSNHALIAQFDESATSSGSLDLQTTTIASDGGYAFTLSGVNGGSYSPVAVGGVFSLSSGAISGTVDVNDSGLVTLANAVNGTLETADRFGRGQINGVSINGVALALNYYVVGPEAMRIIDVDPGRDPAAGNAAVGSAFGQGSGAFTKASLGKSVFAVASNAWGSRFYCAEGMLVPNSGAGKFTGVADDDEEGIVVAASAISGTYSIETNGYGNLLIKNAGLQAVTSFGLYATDPTLNLLDPSNAAGGGGALILDLDPALASGTGIIIPQSDASASSFTGNYAIGAQDYNDKGTLGWEFDFVGQGSVAGGVLTGTGLVNDVFAFFSVSPAVYAAVPFSGTATPDLANPGRYSMEPLDVTVLSGSPVPFSVVIYQASGGELFWMDEGSLSLSLGTIQQEPVVPLAGLTAKRKYAARKWMQHK